MGQKKRVVGQKRRVVGQKRRVVGQKRRVGGQKRRVGGQKRRVVGQKRRVVGQKKRMWVRKKRVVGQKKGIPYFGVMAGCTVKMYRKEKPSVQKLVMANMQAHGSLFWKRVSKNLAGHSVSAFLVPSNSAMHPTVATWLIKALQGTLT